MDQVPNALGSCRAGKRVQIRVTGIRGDMMISYGEGLTCGPAVTDSRVWMGPEGEAKMITGTG